MRKADPAGSLFRISAMWRTALLVRFTGFATAISFILTSDRRHFDRRTACTGLPYEDKSQPRHLQRSRGRDRVPHQFGKRKPALPQNPDRIAAAAPATAFMPWRAAYASDAGHSRGRLFPEAHSPTRSEFQRDRDRILHSTAFRRLAHKTQVFIPHEGDHYRTRLTHSIEVGQIARALARALGLDDDLAEALALAHDLGHTPFGHTGEDALDEAMRPYGGFDHNAQALRIVTKLEHRYAAFDGLNLSWETLEGLVKHNGPITGKSKPVPLAITEY